ncbi:MAG: hypothetical protein V4754_16190 [Pseudomonadota bacterium]
MSQASGYPEQGYVVVPRPSLLPSGRYSAQFDIFDDIHAPQALYRHAGQDKDFATEMAARTEIQAQASNWIDAHPLK